MVFKTSFVALNCSSLLFFLKLWVSDVLSFFISLSCFSEDASLDLFRVEMLELISSVICAIRALLLDYILNSSLVHAGRNRARNRKAKIYRKETLRELTDQLCKTLTDRRWSKSLKSSNYLYRYL